MPERTSGDALRRLSGGVIADVWLITWVDGTSAVGKIGQSVATLLKTIQIMRY